MRTLLLRLAILTAATAAVPAQGTVDGNQQQIVDAIGSATPGLTTDRDADGRLWVAGASYKASFAADGTMFAPYLGADAPRTFPTRFERARIAVGGTTLATQEVQPVLAGEFVAFVDDECTERYRLAEQGIEQQFVLSQLPNRGAIEVAIPVTTHFAVHATGDGHQFVNDHGSFGYGRAIAVDASGDRIELDTRWTGAGFQITVPESFVAHAALPLVIDPWLATATSLANSTYRLTETDIAYDASLGVYAVSWERVYSATDRDVYLQYFDNDMLPVGSTVAVDVSVTSWQRPRIAGVNGQDRFLVVAEVSTGNVSPFHIGGRVSTGTTPTLGVQLTLAQGVVDLRQPDVGGEPRTSGSQWLLVYETVLNAADHDIYARLVSSTGVAGNSSVVDGAVSLDVQPVVSKTCGSSGGYERWGVVYQRQLGNGTCQPMFATVSTGGTTFAAAIPWGAPIPDVGAQLTVAGPSDVDTGRRFLLTHAYPTLTGSAWRSHAVDLYGGALASSLPYTSPTLLAPGLDSDCDGLRFVVTRTGEWHTAPGTYYVNTTLYGIVGSTVDLQDIQGALVNGPSFRAGAVVALRTGGDDIDPLHGVAWIEDVSSSACRVQVRRYQGMQFGDHLHTRTTGCGALLGHFASATVFPGGSVSYGLSATPGLQGMIAGLPVDRPIGPCPGCRQGADGGTIFGNSLSFGIPRHASFVGLTLSVQPFRFVAPGTGACLGEVDLGDTLDITIR